MADSNSIIPISDEQAKAIRAAIEALSGVGNFLREVVGTVPADLVGYFGGDWLKVRRAENAAKILEKAQERLRARGTKPERPSVSVALPILVAGADEDRDELQDIWARLLAAAMDPTRSKMFRAAFINAAKQMDPLDCVVLVGVHARSDVVDPTGRQALSTALQASRDEVDVSISNLMKLDLMVSPDINQHRVFVSAFGREFLRAVSD